MNTSITPNHKPEPNEAGSAGLGLAKLAGIVGGSLFLIVVILALLLPALDHRHRGHGYTRRTTQVRGIVQGLVNYASGNKERMPGTTSKGYIIYDNGDVLTSDTGASGHGATVEARFWLMLDNNNFSGDYVISPSENKTAWTTGPVTSDNYSFSLLNIHDGKSNPTGKKDKTDKVRPSESGRVREWKQSISTQAVLIADRARIPGGRIGNDYNKIYSIHTTEDSEYWAGGIGRGDGSASFENENTQDTKYGVGPTIEADRLFALDQDSDANIDVIQDTDATWDDKSNALLGYTSVGYEDGDIASD